MESRAGKKCQVEQELSYHQDDKFLEMHALEYVILRSCFPTDFYGFSKHFSFVIDC